LFGDYNDEWGSFSLAELEEYKDKRFGLGIERDLHFTETPMSEIIKNYTKGVLHGSFTKRNPSP